MFPEETHAKIVKTLDEIECEMFGLYRKLERLRLGLQEQWHVTPADAEKTERHPLKARR